MRLREAIIGVSNYISGLCYSIIRLEPYSTCALECRYCYARWYWSSFSALTGESGIVRVVTELGKMLKQNLKVIPPRLATLSDPFQPIERRLRISLRTLKQALKFGVPMIVNSKVQLMGRDWLNVMRELSREGLLVYQLTIPYLNEQLAQRLEPYAPPPAERLKVAETLSALDVPVVARVQPLVPWITDRELAECVDALKNAGVRMIIIEFLRVRKPLPLEFPQDLDLDVVEWEGYESKAHGLRAKILRPISSYRIKMGAVISSLARSAGLQFSTCKEGLFAFHVPADKDCCGMFLLNSEVGYRPTLKDVYMLAMERGSVRPDELWKWCDREEHCLYGAKLEGYPSWFKKAIRRHENRLNAILRSPGILSRLTPFLRIDADGSIRATKLEELG